ncbi:MAG: hypothetical protein ACL7BU_10825 [Candidatus Phlomobacter fragariae]
MSFIICLFNLYYFFFVINFFYFWLTASTGFISESGKIIVSSSLVHLFVCDVVPILADINVIVVLGEMLWWLAKSK